MALKSKITRAYMTLGSDPELFFTKGGQVVGSEKVLPSEAQCLPDYAPSGKVIRDGIQAELNPLAQSCRQYAGNQIGYCFQNIARIIQDTGVKVSFDVTVPITKEEMYSLSPKSQQFGCTPSLNAYLKKQVLIEMDASKYLFRSAGGHIHLGFLNSGEALAAKVKDLFQNDHVRMVKLLDYVLGNTCVLIDRDPGNKERRKIYGKAGEYRLPKHGLEYRTLSNFWLRDYRLMSLVMGLARQTVSIAASSTPESDFMEEILGAVPEEDIRKAINENDLRLANRNFKKIMKIVARITPIGDGFSLTETTIPRLMFLSKQGIDKYAPKDPLAKWQETNVGFQTGWEAFAGGNGKLAVDMRSMSERVRVAIEAVAAIIS